MKRSVARPQTRQRATTQHLLDLAVHLPPGEPLGATMREIDDYADFIMPNAPVLAAVWREACETFRHFTGHRLVPIPEDWLDYSNR